MNELLAIFLVCFAIWLLIMLTPDRPSHHPGPSWFDIMPTLSESKKRKTRAQQTRRHGSKRYGA